jgi:hypothetical protein
MKYPIAYLLLSAVIMTPAFGDNPNASAPSVGRVVAAGSLAVVHAGNAAVSAGATRIDQPTEDCCYDPVILEREAPAPRADRGPQCCWDASNWE